MWTDGKWLIELSDKHEACIERTSLSRLVNASSPPGAAPMVRQKSTMSSCPPGAVLPSGVGCNVPINSTVDSMVSVNASYVCA